MGLETKLLQKLNQSLLMTPQLQQAIKLLQLGRLEYKEAIERELLDNPVLEEAKESEDDFGPGASAGGDNEEFTRGPLVEEPPPPADSAGGNGEKTPADWEEYLENFSDWRGSATPRGLVDFEDKPSLEATLTKSGTLEDHLLEQLRMIEVSDREREVLFQIIGNLDVDGFLCSTYEEIAEAAHGSVEEVQHAMGILKSLDPAGVGARTLQECLLMQLEDLGFSDGLEAKIVSLHLDKLEKRKYDFIAKAEDVSFDEIKRAIATIQSLEPRPGKRFNEETIRYITPDAYIQKIGNDYVVSLNEDGLPKLKISPYYLQLLKNGDKENAPNKSYLTERLKAASWLIKSIHQRQNTIYKVAESIAKFQRDFLDHGIHKLRPLVLKDVADDIGMHESTVSRVTTSKYVHTPQGVFELKYFFTTGLRSSTGEDVSASSIREKIKNLIAAESQDAPLSDQQIVEILKKEDVTIARRTVAKYREGLGIESSSRRKRLL